MESPILIDVWTLDPSRRVELAKRITDGVRGVVARRPGFVSAELYESTTGDAMMVTIRMQTIKQRQELMDSPEARKLLRDLKAVATSHARLFRLLESFGATPE
jgi:antibiotic biosynthesis monooxygenase (ABM) superfamily enzyme